MFRCKRREDGSERVPEGSGTTMYSYPRRIHFHFGCEEVDQHDRGTTLAVNPRGFRGPCGTSSKRGCIRSLSLSLLAIHGGGGMGRLYGRSGSRGSRIELR